MRRLKIKMTNFINNDNDVPILAGFVSGFYPFIYYYSENFSGKNSLEHLLFLSFFFIGISVFVFLISNFIFNKISILKPYKKHMYFILVIMLVASGMSKAIYLKLMKKFLAIMLLAVIGFSIKFHKEYKKLIVLVVIMSVIPLGNTMISLYDSLKPLSWMQLPDNIESVIFKNKPNIYLIQPDGYVNQSVMGDSLYNYKSDLYPWLSNKSFKLYSHFTSNYASTLLSNSSLFSMKQHFLGNVTFPKTDMIHSRDIISGNNPVISIFKNNDYKTYLLAQDEYFQMNYCKQNYDYTNVTLDEISYFSTGDNLPKVLFEDLKKVIDDDEKKAKFFFIEKLRPHHVFMNDHENKIEEERRWYLKRVEEANIWLKNIIEFIEQKDENSIIIVLADHGGMVGMDYYIEKYSNNNKDFILSSFSVLAAIKWSGNLKAGFDNELRSNVNIFRVLFSVLSENPKYLNHLEDNSSYNLNYENPFYNSVYKPINDRGRILLKTD